MPLVRHGQAGHGSMRTVSLDRQSNVMGLTVDQVMEMNRDFAQYDAVRKVERWSIREFMRENAGLLTGRVLDFGAGEQPYKSLVTGEYVPYSPDKDTTQTLTLLQGSVDVVMCNQVTQYVQNLAAMLNRFRLLLKPCGYVVATFATNWDEVEDTDLHRHTSVGMRKLMFANGFDVLRCERRAEVTHGAFKFPLGYGIVARKVNL